ncbi:hypothetical protein SynRS9909_01232 [Synechococcus sp. RS9909]|nr:hypothetical protein SynRS9909_01232 [Synechococcus sp. RS9909]
MCRPLLVLVSRQHGCSRTAAVLLNPFCPITTAVYAMQHRRPAAT